MASFSLGVDHVLEFLLLKGVHYALVGTVAFCVGKG